MNKTKRVLSIALAALIMLSMAAVIVIADGEICDVVIEYKYTDGKKAAPSWTAKVAKGSIINQTVTSPAVVGYTPDQATVSLNVSNIQNDMTVTVTYKPALVNFTVKHYQQNVDNDKYNLADTVTAQGYTEAEVGGNLAKTYEGFTALLYDTTTKIAADGSTVVEIYYDRNYYMLSLNLDGGYGAEPVYARYGAKVEISNPTKPGYTFAGWDPTLPETVPAGNKTYTAQWQKNNANYTVQYWQENANDDGYSYKESTTKSAPSGNAVSGTNDKTYAGFTYNAEKTDKDVIVKGDGSTVVNVYYKRDVYEVMFYKQSSRKWVEDASLRITAKYGAFIGDKWPGGGWYVDESGKTAQSYLSIMPLNGMSFYGQQTGSYTATATYYVEVLPGESGTLVGGKYYKEHHKDTAKYNKGLLGGGLTVTDEDRYDIAGYTCNKAISTKNEADYNGAKFYYDRNKYKLEFNDNFEHSVSDDMFFEQQLKESPRHKANYEPQYPSGLEAGAYDFGGWYIDKSCTEQVNWEAKMPATNLIVYAKWAPKTHTVKTWLTDAMDAHAYDSGVNEWTVAHRSTIEEPATPENGNYTFVGWFYKENGVEKAFDFSMAVTKDLDLYAKWSSNTPVVYTIRYELEDGTEIAAETTGSALAGTTKTFEAKTGTDLYESYQSGYFPTTASHSLTMDIEGKNEFTFVYVEKEKVGYTVRYLEKDTNKVLHEENTATTSDNIITEQFVPIAGYAPDAYSKRLVLSADEEKNVITFWYTKDKEHAPVQVIHWIQNIEGNEYTEHLSSTDLNGVIGQEYSEAPLNISGFTFKEGKVGDTATALVDGKLKGTVTENGLVLNLYYDRMEYGYTIKYVDVDDNTIEVAETQTGTARFGAQVTAKALENISGYQHMHTDSTFGNDPDNKEKIISKEEEQNVITFYYCKCYYIGHVQSGKLERTDTVRLYANSQANLTDAVTSGYLYGGAFSDETCENVQEFKPGESAIGFKPEKGTTYYIWEVSETYLKPRAYVVWRHDPTVQPISGSTVNVVGLYLTSSIDRKEYQYAGFTVNGTDISSKDVYEKVRTVYENTDTVKEEMYVDADGVWRVAAPNADGMERGGYVIMHTVNMTSFYNTNAENKLSYQPYWVTLDGIRVTGAYEARTCYYQGVGYDDVWISDCVSSNSVVGIYTHATTNTIGVENVAVLSAEPETVQPEVPVTPEVPEVPEAPEMTLNSDAMYLRAQYTYEMMTNTVKFISAIDVNACTEYGFVINGEVIKCEEAAEAVDGYDANYLFGGSVNGAMLMSCNMLLDGFADGMTINVTPYCIDLNGNVVYGETRTLVYRQWVGLEG